MTRAFREACQITPQPCNDRELSMRYDQIETWASHAARVAPVSLQDVRTDYGLAVTDWTRRVRRPEEMHDLAPFAGGPVDARHAAHAAAGVAVEMAIIVCLFPQNPEVLHA